MIIVPVLCVVSMRWIDPVTSAIMLQNNIHNAIEGKNATTQFKWLDWENISAHAAVAVIAAEDQRFPSHFGIDFNELRKAISANRDKKRGASTITQQVAKNLFLWPGRSYLRKTLEAGFSLLLELFWSKQRILEVYLNIAQMGTDLFGVGAASIIYYNKPAAQLNKYEAARIAAVLPNPSRYSVLSPSANVVQRQQWILKQMKQLGGTALLDTL